ncbi:MAG: hypothetical protein Q9M15_04815 [Mariprofundaceae bacterium]|nr:hypothetical protein [Mariprofundaceae bacterium]
MQQGIISRTPRGRVATPLAYSHLGKILPYKAHCYHDKSYNEGKSLVCACLL